jgi:hypothetical protein
MLKSLYFFLFIIGSAIPYSQFIPFLWEHGLDFSLFFSQLFANPISRFFAFDLLISAIALWVWVYAEGRRLSMSRLWLYPLITLSIGVSAALPFFLWMREWHSEKSLNSIPLPVIGSGNPEGLD